MSAILTRLPRLQEVTRDAKYRREAKCRNISNSDDRGHRTIRGNSAYYSAPFDLNVAIVTMDNGRQANTIDIPLCEGIVQALTSIESSPQCRAVVLRGTGSVFSAGGDLARILAGMARTDGFLESLISAFHAAILAIRHLKVPVVASVQGAAAGGGFSLAMTCDVVVAARTARFVVGYPKLGTSSDGGLSFQLARRLGAAGALDVFLLRDSLSAEEASSLGFVQRVTDLASLEVTSLGVARQFAGYPPTAVAEIKSLVGLLWDDGLRQHLEHEKQAFLRCTSTEVFRQQVAQFVEQSGARKASTSS